MPIIFHSLAILLHTCATSVCTYDRWCMTISQSNKHVVTNKSWLRHDWALNFNIRVSQGSSLLFVSVLTLLSFCYYSKFYLGILLETCLGISIIFNLRILITRISVIAHKIISGAEEIFLSLFQGRFSDC